MTEKEKKFLADIEHSIELIESFIIEIKSFEQYSKDEKTKSAVERHLGIIGEAVNKFLKSLMIISLKMRFKSSV
ncbi:HepT-like ribonuclease domain-containing protein [Pedobacter cryophilus]|uniref:HepT-like ribonuclease domain-containing protein n=1 Tax=Pedobacter cryophilus TaxID=2571271 RepID=UPI00197DF4E6|nr:HepT-like ribonuclease domain-containing protein [Pedobacter cryophilus]